MTSVAFKPAASGGGTGSSAGVHYVHTDQISGSNAISDSTGALEELTDYYPFGQIRLDQKATSFSEQRKYAGTIHDDTSGLDYMSARYYADGRGGFISEDPVHLAIGDANKVQQITGKTQQAVLADPNGALNSYSYAGDNPIIRSDPTGLWYKEFFTGQQSWSSFHGELNDAAYQLGNQSPVWNYAMEHPKTAGAVTGFMSIPIAQTGLEGSVALGEIAAPGVSLAYSAARVFEGTAYLYLAQGSFKAIPAVLKQLSNVSSRDASVKSYAPPLARLIWEVGPSFTGEYPGAIADVVNLATSVVNNLKSQVEKVVNDKNKLSNKSSCISHPYQRSVFCSESSSSRLSVT
jgi:RHS repeat-associated protein